jgi:hypothetical protein
MEVSYAVNIIDAVVRDNLTETGDLLEIQEECAKNPEFERQLTERCLRSDVEDLRTLIEDGIASIRSHHFRMARRGGRRGRW